MRNIIRCRYVEFVLRKYGKSTTVIFDAYETGPSVMDEKNLRNKKGICGVEVSFTGTTPLKSKKQQFLNNPKNKNSFVKFLSERLERAGFNSIYATGDGNALIARTAVDSSQQNSTIVIGSETNLLILLCFYANDDTCGLYLRSDKKIKATKSTRLWNILQTKNMLGSLKSTYLLFVHAFGGCQTTSRIFGVGEGVLYSKLNDKQFSGSL